MNKNYKAVPYKTTIHHPAIVNEKEPWDNMPAYNEVKTRFQIVSTETGEVLDDAQGYGYKTAQKAYAGYAYKTRDKSKDRQRAAKKRHIAKWMKENPDFITLMDECALDIAKGRGEPDEKFNAAFVKSLLKENNLSPDFTASELLREWRKS